MKGAIAIVVAVTMWSFAAGAAEPVESIASGAAPIADARTWLTSVRPVVELESFGGQKHVSRGAFRALDEQSEAGLRATIVRRESDVFGLTMGILESRAERRGPDYHIAARTRETGLGVRMRIEGRRADAFVSAGAAILETEIAAAYPLRTWEMKETGAGVWYAIGVRAPLGSRVTVGAEVRQTIGGVYGPEHSSRANGFHVGGTIGVRFGQVRGGAS